MNTLGDPGPSSNETMTKDSWIWHVAPAEKGKMTEKEVEEWFDKCTSPLPQYQLSSLIISEGDSVQWHRARALVERWDEDVETIEEEFRRTIWSFLVMSQTWLGLGQHFELSGHRAYALEKSATYSRMAQESRDLFEMAGGRWPAEGETLVDYIEQLRRKQQRFVCHISVFWLRLYSFSLQAIW